MKFPYRLSLFLFFATPFCTTHAQSDSEREFKQLQEQREKALSAAIEPINRRYQASLQQLLRRATQVNDLKTAVMIREELESLELVVAGLGTRSDYVGVWRLIKGDYNGTRELKPDGTFLENGSPGQSAPNRWAIVGKNLILTYSKGDIEKYRLPLRDGKLDGGDRTLTKSN